MARYHKRHKTYFDREFIFQLASTVHTQLITSTSGIIGSYVPKISKSYTINTHQINQIHPKVFKNPLTACINTPILPFDIAGLSLRYTFPLTTISHAYSCPIMAKCISKGTAWSYRNASCSPPVGSKINFEPTSL